jgi:hypothetical protein
MDNSTPLFHILCPCCFYCTTAQQHPYPVSFFQVMFHLSFNKHRVDFSKLAFQRNTDNTVQSIYADKISLSFCVIRAPGKNECESAINYSLIKFKKKTSFSLRSSSFENGMPSFTVIISFEIAEPSFCFFICSTCCFVSCEGLPIER